MTNLIHFHARVASALRHFAASASRLCALGVLLVVGAIAPWQQAHASSGVCNLQNQSASPVAVHEFTNVSLTFDIVDQSNCAGAGGMSYSITITPGTTTGTLVSPSATGALLPGPQTITVQGAAVNGNFTVTFQCTFNCSTTGTLTWVVNVENVGLAYSDPVSGADTIVAGTPRTLEVYWGGPTLPKSGTTISWAVTSEPSVGAANLTPTTDITDASGLATTVFTGAVAGAYQITASAPPGCTFCSPLSQTFNITVTAPPDADLAIAIADSPDPVDPVGSITYTISAGNAGPDIATSAVWTTTLPSELVFSSLTPAAGWTCTDPGVGNNGTINCTNASFGVTSVDDVFTLVAALSGPPSAGTIITTAASISSAVADSNSSNDNATTTTTVATSADLHTSISDSPDPVLAGANITYTITANNDGPDAASSVSLDFEVPTNTTLASLTPAAGWTCTDPGVGNTGPVNCTIASLAALASDSFTLVVTVGGAVPAATIITNNVNITGADADPDIADNDSFADTTVAPTPTAALSINITDAPDPVTAGNQITYTLDAFYSTGPDLDTDVSFVLPAGTTFASVTPDAGWSCTTPVVGGTGTVSCNNPAMPGDNNDLIVVVVNVDVATPGGTIITATANISSLVFDPDTSNNTSTTTTLVNAAPTANLNVAVTDSPDPVDPGANLTYTITVGNAGPDAAAGASLSNAIPANTTFVSFTAPVGWSCITPAVGGTGTVSCGNPSLAALASDVFTLVVAVDAAAVGGSTITDSASVSSSTFESDTSDDNASTTTAVSTSADLGVSVSDAPDPVNAGSSLTYTITVNNAGPDAAASASLSNAIPANTTFASLTPAAGWSCTTPAVGSTGTVSCTSASVAALASDVFTLVVTVNGATAAGTIITDTANVASATTDFAASNNSASATTTVATPPSANLGVSVTDTPDPVNAGSVITYTITVNNAGPDAAASATLSNAIPTNTTFASLTPAAGWSCTTPAVGATGTVSCTNASVAAFASDVFTLAVTVDPAIAGGTTITDSVSVGSATADSAPSDNIASTTTTVATPSADLAVSVTDTPDPVAVGANITYTITVNNLGPDAAASATLSNAIPANTLFVSLTPAVGWSCTTPAVGATGTVSCTSPSVAASASDVFTLVVTVDPAAIAASGATSISDTAIVGSATGDVAPTNNSATTTTAVAAPLSADLAVSVTDTPDPVNAGSVITYTITVNNAGPDAAASATLSNAIPTNTTFASLTPAAGWSCTTPAVGATGTVSCTNASVAALASDVFTLAVTVDPATAGGTTITDTATVGSATGDPVPGNNSASTTTTVATVASADIGVALTDAPDPVAAGATITYSLTVTNAGPDAAANATLSDAIPANTTFASLAHPGTWSCSAPAVGATGTIFCSNPSLAASASDVFTVVVTVDPATAGGTTIIDTATVGSATADPAPANNNATTTTLVASNPALSVAKTFDSFLDNDGNSLVTQGDTLEFTVIATNSGDVPLTNVVVTDPLLTPGSANCPSVLVGATCTLSGTHVVTALEASNGTFSNTATADSFESSPATSNTVNVSIDSPAMAVAKTFDGFTDNDGSTTITVGDTLAYTVTATNTGDVPLTNVVVTDPQLTPGSNTCPSLAVGAACTLGGTHVVTALEAGANNVSNTATADSGETAAQNSNTVNTPVATIGQPVLTIVAGDGQFGLTSTVADIQLEVSLRDGLGNPMANQPVTWTATGAGTVAPTTVLTDAAGHAKTTLTFGATAGAVSIDASTPLAATVTFTATAQSGGIGIASGDNQTGPINTTLPLPLKVVVTDPLPLAKAGRVSAQALDGVPVTFAVTSGGGSVAPVTVLTDVNGEAATQFTLGPIPGTQTVTATISGGASVTFTATATLARTLAIVSGNGQTAAPGSQLPAPLVVHAQDNGLDAGGVGINWIVTGPATVTPSGPTDANGVASATVTLGATPGAVTIRAERIDDPTVFVTFTANTAKLQQIPGLTPDELELAIIIDDTCSTLAGLPSLTPPQQDFLTRCQELIDASILDPGSVQDALDALLPGAVLAFSEASFNAAQAQFQNLKARIAALRAGTQGNSFQGLAFTGPGGTVSLGALGAALTQDGDEPAKPSGEIGSDFQRWGFFASGTIGRGEAEAGSTRPAYDYDINGLTLGLDYRKSDTFIFGAAVGYTRQDTELRDVPGQMDMSGWSVSGYATWYRDNSWYTDAVLTWGRNSFDLLRTVTYTVPLPGGGSSTVSQSARSQSDGDMLEGAFTFGRDFQAGGWSIGPYGRILYTKLDFERIVDEMDTGPGSGLGLSIDARSLTSLASEIGAKFTFAHSTDWGVVTPHFQLEWEHEFKDDPKALTARFLADPNGQPFTIRGEDLDTDYFRMSLGLSIIMKRGRSGFLIYEKTLGRSGFSQDNLGFGVRIEF